MTLMGQKLAEILKLASAARIDVPNLMLAVSQAVMMERERAISILEAPMERLQKHGSRETLELLYRIRDDVFNGVGS